MTETTASALLRQATGALAGCSDTPRLDAEMLLQGACDIDRTAFARDPDQLVNNEKEIVFAGLLARRCSGEPIAYILGRKEFWSLELSLNEATLVPRPETEILVQAVLDAVPANAAIDIVDLGTGSGAIALALARERPLAQITATDISARALEQAIQNAAHLGLSVRFCQDDWFAALTGKRFDIIVSNPPYVRENDPALECGPARFEPARALFAGTDGLSCLRQICAGAMEHLKPAGMLALEHGHDQQTMLATLLSAAGLESIVHFDDHAGLARVTTARKPASIRK